MAKKLTEAEVRRRVREFVRDCKGEFQRGYFDKDTGRESLIEWM